MRTTIRKIQNYITIYIWRTKWIKNMVLPVVIALILSTYLDVQCSAISSQITSKSKEGANTEKLHLLKIFILYFTVEYLLKYIISIFNVQFIAVSMRTGFKNFFEEYLRIKYADFHKIGVGEAQYNIVRRSTALADFLTSFTMYFMANAFFFVIALHSGINGIEWHTKLVVVCAVLVFIGMSIVIQYFRARIRKKVNDGFQKNSKKLYDILFNYERIVAYDNIAVESDKYWDAMNDQVFYSTIYWVSYEVADAVNNIAFILLNVYLIKQFNNTRLITRDNFQDFTVLFTKLGERMFEMSRNIDDIFTQFTNLDQSMIRDCPVEADDGAVAVDRFDREIKIKDLSFSHGDKLVFKDVNGAIRKGEMIAITGVNGAGKSTFVKILLGLYDYEGVIEIDGNDCSRISKKAIRGLINYIPQNSFLFQGSVLENLTMANKEISHEKLVEYMKLYNTHEAFRELGYDKDVGERGKNLSGGQAQKIAFMRAVVKNSYIFVLDEATSNMDTASEMEIISALKKNAANKTVIMIIHNLNLLSAFDRVFFFANKTLEEQGSFDELYNANRRFTKFYNESTGGDSQIAN